MDRDTAAHIGVTFMTASGFNVPGFPPTPCSCPYLSARRKKSRFPSLITYASKKGNTTVMSSSCRMFSELVQAKNISKVLGWLELDQDQFFIGHNWD